MQDEAKQTNLFNSDAVTGQFVLIEQEGGNSFTVSSAELLPAELHRINRILSAEQKFEVQA